MTKVPAPADPITMPQRGGTIGVSVLRKEDPPLLTGAGCFVDDLDRPGVAHACILRSPHAQATIADIDVASARRAPGVVDVVTAADVDEGLRIPMRMHARPELDPYLQPPLARGVVRYSGEPVAVVVAESRYAAEDAAELIDVDYEPQPPVLEGPEALEGGAPLLFPSTGSNLAAEIGISEGDPEGAFERAELTVEEVIACQRHAAVPLEPRGLVAEVEQPGGQLVVWGAAKIVHLNRRILARLLGWPLERVRLVELHVGGGFGGRGEFYPEDFLIPFCAIRLGRPVKWTADREEDMRSTNHSREQVHEIALALAGDGEFLALRDRITFNTGAYIRTHGTVVASMAVGMLPGPYRWGALDLRVRQVLANKTPAGTYRAPGRYEANLARERLIDIAAHRLGIDPVELRRRNLVGPAAMPYRSGTHIDGQPVVYDSGDYPRLLERALDLFDTVEMAAWRRADAPPGRRRGLGLAFFVEKSGIANWDYARVELDSRGKAVVHAGSASIGQGVETVLAQICAEGLGLGYDDVAAVRHGDTADVPDGMGSFGSRATSVAGSAVFQAARALRRRVLARAAEMLEAAERDLEIVGGRVVPRGSPGRGVTLAELVEGSRPVSALPGGEPGMSEESYFYADSMSFPYGVHSVAVEVDLGTGGIEIERYAVAYDVGRAVNPVLIRGQIVGGAAQGLGGAMLEEMAYGPEGQHISASFMDYLMPTAGEVPGLRVLVTEDAPSPLNPIGAKGAGEGGTAAAGAALANAVSDALGVEATRLPLTPERVLSLAPQAMPAAAASRS